MKGLYSYLADLKIGGEPVIHIVWCVGLILLALLLKRSLANILAKITYRITNRFSDKKHADTFRELLQKPLELLLTTILFYIALNQLTVLLGTGLFSRVNESGKVKYAIHLIDAIDKIFLFFLIIFITLVISRIADFIFHILIDHAFDENNREREQLLPLIKDVAKILLWTMGIFWILGSVFNVNIPALITGLGIGGVAIALAAKESVENFFASFTILTDKPFRTGDSIRLDSFEGKVEKVGFRSTRLRNIDGSLYIIPNKNLIGDNLENLSERNNHRVKVVVNIPYGLSYERIKGLIATLKEMLQQTDLLKDKNELSLDTFNENFFAITIIYTLPSPLPAGKSLADIKHQTNMKIYQVLESYLPSGIQKYELVKAESPPSDISPSSAE